MIEVELVHKLIENYIKIEIKHGTSECRICSSLSKRPRESFVYV